MIAMVKKNIMTILMNKVVIMMKQILRAKTLGIEKMKKTMKMQRQR